MPTKSKPFKANQRASGLLPASAESFVSPSPPSTIRNQPLRRSSSASSKGVHPRSIILSKPAHHLYVENSVGGVGGCGQGGSQKEQNKLIDCKPSYDVSTN